ncbi:30S ribosomal protein S8e [Candidatus Pacearchaeota archaeon]|nr:30S ribosomal protein S8e [Candidatus Pacearchaeota archaeon]
MNYGRKISGGKYHKQRKKKLYEKRNPERQVTLGDTKTKKLYVRGGARKVILLRANVANISIKGKTKHAEIKNVEETPQNRFFARQNRLMKGAIIETSMGKARITNRPSQEGCVNAVLLEQK